MKILTFSDIHGSIKAIHRVKQAAKLEKPDLILFGGDLTVFGRDHEKMMEELDKIGQEILIIDGNHETVVELRKAAAATKNVTFFNAKTRRIGNFLVIGYGVNGFSLTDQHFEDFISRIKQEFQPGDKIIMLSHGPPYGTKVDLIIDQHCGSKSLRDFIEKYHPVLVISGHLHETFNMSQKLGKTFIINPGPFGKIITIN